jgi:hypothetical protein
MFLIAHDTIVDHHRAVPRRRDRPVGMWPDEGSYPRPDAQFDDPLGVRAQVPEGLRPLIDRLRVHRVTQWSRDP